MPSRTLTDALNMVATCRKVRRRPPMTCPLTRILDLVEAVASSKEQADGR